MNVFDCAIKMEEAARKQYEELATQATVPELKNLFTILAAAEQEHQDALVRLKKDAKPSKAQFKALEGAACVFQPLLSKRELMAGLKIDPDAYLQMVKEEEKEIGYFVESAEQAKDEGVREILLQIAEEERKHLSIVENIYAFVESPKNFLAWGEFSNLKEY